MKRKILLFALMAMVLLVTSPALADSSVAWISPTCGSSFLVGTVVNPTGQASGVGGTGGTGLDLMLVMDVSGSMAGAGLTNAKSAANSLIDSLPPATTQAGLASFASSGSLVQQLIPLVPAANVTTLHTAVNSLSAGGGTYIGLGIGVATTELQSSRAIAGHAKMEVVLSDGFSSGDPVAAAAAAYAAGITVHSVGVPGHDPTTMQNIATAGHGVYTNVSDLSDLENIFNGTGGNLVALDYVDIILPDGTLLSHYATDGLGNFTLPDWTLLLGDNLFTATAFGTDGTSATAYCHLYGTAVPVPGSLLLLGSGLFGLAGFRMRFWR
jgi:Ca-activated chloride channel family protein